MGLPEQIGGYEIIDLIAEGGMGVVLKARDPSLDRIVALKLLTDTGQDESLVARFEREAKLAAQLRHPNVCHIYAVGVEGVSRYIVMEYVDGRTLEDIVESGGAIDPARALEIIEQAARALSAAADLGLVHRDVKPANVMVNHKGEVKLVDFGLARRWSSNSDSKLTAVNQVLGTPDFLSPEQAQNTALDFRSDMYSLGATLYYAITGEPPFPHDDPIATIVDHVRMRMPDPRELAPSVSDEVADLIARLCQKSPADRYARYADLLAAIGEIRAQGTATDDPQRPRRKRKTQANPEQTRTRVLGLLLGLALALLAYQNRKLLVSYINPRAVEDQVTSQLIPPRSANFDHAGPDGAPVGWAAIGENYQVGIQEEEVEGESSVRYARASAAEPDTSPWQGSLVCTVRAPAALRGKRLILGFKYRFGGKGEIRSSIRFSPSMTGTPLSKFASDGVSDESSGWKNATLVHDVVDGSEIEQIVIKLEIFGDSRSNVDIDSISLYSF